MISLTFMPAGIGRALFSILLYVRDHRRKGAMMLSATAIAGIMGCALPFIPSFPLFLCTLVLMGATFSVNTNLLNIIVQTRVDTAFLGRSHSLLILLAAALVPIGNALFTRLLTAMGLARATIGGSVLVFVGSFGFLLIPGWRQL